MTDYESVRSDWWALLNWHLKINGTRPEGNPPEPGDLWTEENFGYACHVGDSEKPRNGARTVQYWLDESQAIIPTKNLKAIETALFGNNPTYAAWRLDLRTAHARASTSKKKAKPPIPDNGTQVSPATGRAHADLPAENVITRVPVHFRGQETLDVIEAAFRRNTESLCIVALHGLRGVGKTTYAIAYSHRCRPECRAVWWIRAQTEPGMRGDLVNFGIRLGWVRSEDEAELALQVVLNRLTHEGEGILLIYDNAIDANLLKPYLPGGGTARIIVTSNNHAWRSVAIPIEIKTWRKEIGADFLLVRSGSTEAREPALALSQALEGLPLAHEMAAAFCEQREISLAAYKKAFDATPVKYLEDARYAPLEYGLTVARAFALAIDAATKTHPAAEVLLAYSASLATEPIPIFLLEDGSRHFEEPFAAMIAGEGLKEALSALRALALIEQMEIVDEHNSSITTQAIRLHRLVREVARSRRSIIERGEIIGRLIKMAIGSFRFEIINHPRIWPRLRRLVPVLNPLVESEADIPELSRGEAVKLLFYMSTYYLQVNGSYKDALPLAEEALLRSRIYFGDRDNCTLEITHHLSVLYREFGRLNEAETLLRPALAISRSFKGERHFLTADLLAGLAIVLNDKGMLQESRELFETALPLFEEHHGWDSPATIMLAGALSILLFNMGEWVEARELGQWSIDTLEARLGPADPRAIAHRQKLEVVLPFNYEKAEKRRQRYISQLEQQEKVLGAGHPDTIETLVLIGKVDEWAGENSKATETYARALTFAEAVYGQEHKLVRKIKRSISDLQHRAKVLAARVQ